MALLYLFILWSIWILSRSWILTQLDCLCLYTFHWVGQTSERDAWLLRAKLSHSSLHKFLCYFKKQNRPLRDLQGFSLVSHMKITTPLVKVDNLFDCDCFKRIAYYSKDNVFYYFSAAYDGLKAEYEMFGFFAKISVHQNNLSRYFLPQFLKCFRG